MQRKLGWLSMMVLIWVTGCASTNAVRCDQKLRPINAPVVTSLALAPVREVS